MKVVIDIPQEYEKHFDEDRFKDSLERIEIDVHDSINEDYVIPTVSGANELELIQMLMTAFKTAEIKKIGHWKNEGYIDMYCSECGSTPDHEPGSAPKATDYCPYCGSEMNGDKND